MSKKNSYPPLAIIIPTICRDNFLMETINSILDNYCENFIILIGDQNNLESYSEEKRIFYETACAKAHTIDPINDRIKIHKLPYDCGISFARNELVKLAHSLGIKYCLIGADSIKFTKSMKDINKLLPYLNRYDLIGMNVKNRISWEGKLNLIKDSHFELDFINTNCKTCDPRKLIIFNVDICRNFFIAKTESLLQCPWDNNLIMSEHESFFWEFKKLGYKVGFTRNFEGEYIKSNNLEYNKIRKTNFNNGKQILFQKYNLKSWMKYKNQQNMEK